MINFKTIIFGIGFTIICFPVFSQIERKAIGEYKMKVENNVTWDDAVKQATQLAQINAIEDVFGKVITQDNSTYISNKQKGDDVQTNSTFNFISNSYVKGEWIEDIEVPKIEKIQDGNDIWIKVTVKGKVREITTLENKFEVHTLSCAELKCRTQQFNDGQDIYVAFKSPEDGFLTIYLSDPEMKYTFLYLPYQSSTTYKKCVPIAADKQYIFFTKSFDYFNEKGNISELIGSVETGNNSEKYQLWLLFSTEPIDKPALDEETITTKKFLDKVSINQGYTLPKGIDSDKFREWLQKYRVINKKVQLGSLFFNVSKI